MEHNRTITLNPADFFFLEKAARSANQPVETFLSDFLSRLFRSLADLQGLQPVTVTPSQIHLPAAPILTETPESLAALPPVSAAGQGATPAPATTTGHPASTPLIPSPAPVDTTAALQERFGITL